MAILYTLSGFIVNLARRYKPYQQKKTTDSGMSTDDLTTQEKELAKEVTILQWINKCKTDSKFYKQNQNVPVDLLLVTLKAISIAQFHIYTL